MMNGARGSMEQMIQSAKEEVSKPDLAPEMRKMYEEQIASAQQSLDNMNKSKDDKALNDADLQLVKKYKAQIEEAEKKYNAQK